MVTLPDRARANALGAHVEHPSAMSVAVRPRRWRSERGSGTLLMVGVMVVVMTLAFTAVVIAGYLAAAHRARAAADLAALSGATEVLKGGDGCAGARRVATANAAQVTACDLVGDQIDYVITVVVRFELASPMAGLPRAVSAVAHAGPVTGS